MKRYSIDFGFRYTKIFPGGNITSCKMIPTATGDATEQHADVSIGYCFQEASGVLGAFSTGYFAVKYGGNATVRQDRKWYETEAFLKCFYGACAEIGIQDGEQVELVICIPIDDKPQTDFIKSLLTGQHSFTLRGQRPITFTVTRVIRALQGISAFFHFCMDLNGQFRIDLQKQKVYIAEPGGNTFHEVMFDGFTDIEAGTKSHYKMGFWNVINDVHQWLTLEQGIDLNILQTAEAVEAREIFVDGQIDLREIVNDLILKYGEKQAAIISDHKEVLRTFHHLLAAGGPGELFLPCYQSINSRFAMMSNPQMANVVGAYKLSIGKK